MIKKEQKIKWIKNFGIKADVLTIHALASGLNRIKSAYKLMPNCVNYKYVDGEEFRDKNYLKELNNVVKEDLKKRVKIIVNKLSQVSDAFELFCKTKGKRESNVDLWNEYKDFCKNYSYLLGICDIPVFVEESVSGAILQELQKRRVKDADKNFKILTVYLKDSCVNQEEKELLEISRKVGGSFSLRRMKKNSLYKRILDHQKKYAWTGYRILLGREHGVNYFVKRIKDNYKNANRELKKIYAKQRLKEKLFNEVAKRHKLNKDLLNCVQLLIWIRDKRYVAITRGPFYKRDLFREIGKRINVSAIDVLYLLPKEIEKALIFNKKPDRQIIKQREKGYALLLLDGNLSKPITGSRLDSLKKVKIQKVSKLQGVSASPGRVTGRVRIVIEDKDFSKFRNREVLVTNMTSPDYAGIMKKAAAIVTDLGGITCHAAIISREFHKPCIIGTEVATKVLKDGQLVEVDANKGVVKILK